METIGKIRRWHRIDKLSISQIARRLGASRNTVKKYLKSNVTAPRYSPRPKRFPVMGPWAARLLELLREDAGKPLRERRNGQRLYDTLLEEGFAGSYPTVQRAVRAWKAERERDGGRVFIPLTFAPGETYQFDWSYETVELGGQVQQVKVAHLRLAHSRVFLAVAYLREAQEMVFDAHWRAFALWGGVARRGIYDNLKTAVDLIFVGKERQYNRRFLQMATKPGQYCVRTHSGAHHASPRHAGCRFRLRVSIPRYGPRRLSSKAGAREKPRRVSRRSLCSTKVCAGRGAL